MVQRALLDRYGKINVLALSKEIGFDHSSVHAAFARGHMTYEMAKAIEDVIGRKVLSFEHLMDPMSVQRETR